jgi:hypothetical protein
VVCILAPGLTIPIGAVLGYFLVLGRRPGSEAGDGAHQEEVAQPPSSESLRGAMTVSARDLSQRAIDPARGNPEAQICGACGAVTLPDDAFCGECGAILGIRSA